jgi:hypothetical protein
LEVITDIGVEVSLDSFKIAWLVISEGIAGRVLVKLRLSDRLFIRPNQGSGIKK